MNKEKPTTQKGTSMTLRLVLSVLACAALVMLAACGGDDDAADADRATADDGAPANGETVKFGALTGVTGDYAPWTEAGLAGAQVAIDEINEAGGIAGHEVQLVVADNQSSVEGAVSGFDQLVEVDDVLAIGNVESDAGVAIVDAAVEREVPVMCPACGTNELNDIGEYMWRLTASDDDQGAILAQYARDHGLQKVAMLVQQTEGTLSTAEVFADVFENRVGGEICEDVRFDPGRDSYRAEVERAWSCDPDAVFLAMGFEAAVPVVQEWERRGLSGPLLFDSMLINEDIAELVDGFDEGAVIGAGPSFDQTSPAYDSFAERYEADTGSQPSEAMWEPVMYDQYIILALAATAAGEVTGPAIAENIRNVTNPPGETVYSYAEGVAILEDGGEIDYHGAASASELTEEGQLAAPVFSILAPGDGTFVPVAAIELDPSLQD